MIYEATYFKNIQGDLISKQKLKAYLEEIGFINIPNPNPPYNTDPDRYYWENDTRREFYVYFPGTVTSQPVAWAHITSGGTDYDFRLAPWNDGGGFGDVLATYTPLYNGGIRFGIRARKEYLLEYYYDSITDYRAGYNNEEMEASLYPAHWFAIVAPEDSTGEWCYILFQKDNGAVEEGSSHHIYNFQEPVLYFHDSVFELGYGPSQGMSSNDIAAPLNIPHPLIPCLIFDSNGNPIKEYTNIYFSHEEASTGNSIIGRHKTNKIITYNDEQYICMTYRGPYVRFR